MALTTVEGVYRAGKVELTEQPPGQMEEARVLVTFIEGTQRSTDQEQETLRQEAFQQMAAGLALGGPPYPKREELYDRFDR